MATQNMIRALGKRKISASPQPLTTSIQPRCRHTGCTQAIAIPAPTLIPSILRPLYLWVHSALITPHLVTALLSFSFNSSRYIHHQQFFVFKLTLLRIVLLKGCFLVQIRMIMIQWEQHFGQDLARKIKADTWERWRKAYQKKFKKEWSDSLFTVVASISLINIQTNSHIMVSIGFGTKSLPLSVIREHAKNALLSDMHAQMLAIRGFQKFIIQGVSRQKCQYFQWHQKRRKFSLKSEFQVALYCSQVFCGDCCINEQEQSFSGAKPLQYFKSQKYPQMKFEPSILRTKPGRLDLPPDKRSPLLSCSDLIALANLVGIQGKQLFNLFTPIYLSTIAVDCQPSLRENIGKGMDFTKRLSSILKRPEKLIERQIFNIVVQGKERKISSQFHRNEPRILVLERQGQEKGRDKEGFQLCGIISQSVEEWINGKSGLPEGSSLKTYKGKGKMSVFSDISIGKVFPREAEAADGFKYEAIQYRLRRLFGEWVGDCLS